jgi:hypothetical protein
MIKEETPSFCYKCGEEMLKSISIITPTYYVYECPSCHNKCYEFEYPTTEDKSSIDYFLSLDSVARDNLIKKGWT